MKTRVKIVVVTENPGIACWPCADYDFQKELDRVLNPVYAKNADIDFDVCVYTELSQAQKDYPEDKEKYQGVLVLLMTCWKQIDAFYCNQAADGIPAIVADVPFCGTGSALCVASKLIRENNLPVPLLSTLNYNEIADAVHLFSVLHKLQQTKILIVTNKDYPGNQALCDTWGCTCVYRGAKDLLDRYAAADMTQAQTVAQKWIDEADGVYEPTREDIIESARLYLAIKALMEECGADAVTVDCLNLSYEGGYGNNIHMYPCLSHYQMLREGITAVCEADLQSTIASLIANFVTGKPGYVSDPVLDTSADQIIYAHCVACPNVFGPNDPRVCRHYIRSHAEDRKGASVQVIFPAGEPLTTIQVDAVTGTVHSSVSVGNVGLEEACRSKLAASANTQALLYNWDYAWHRITVFGDYRKQFLHLFKMKNLHILEEDKM